MQTKYKGKRVVIVMPAYNAEKTLARTYYNIPKELRAKVIVVDDESQDKTVKVAQDLGLETFVHPKNLGYGGNQKTCYWEALKSNPDMVVMIHPDYQYDATLTPDLIKPIIDGRFDIMLGSRIRSRKEALEGGMPLYKYFGNRFLTLIENFVLGLNLSEYHTGFRAYTGRVLRTLPVQRFSPDFVFDQQILISAIASGFKIGEISIPVRYLPEASSINFSRSVRYGIMTLLNLLQYILYKLGVNSNIFAKKRR
jgi:glycosyltransferase involved in cell wall biosynthesis